MLLIIDKGRRMNRPTDGQTFQYQYASAVFGINKLRFNSIPLKRECDEKCKTSPKYFVFQQILFHKD